MGRKMRKISVVCLAALMIAAGCGSNQENDDKGQDAAAINPTNSLEQSTGNVKLDSLLQAAATAPQDTNLALTYYRIGNMYEGSSSEKAKEYFLKCKNLSEQLNWSKGRFLSIDGYSIMLARGGSIDSAIIISLQGLEWTKKEKNDVWTVVMYNDVGQLYYAKGWNEPALRYLMEALPILDRINSPGSTAGKLYENIAKVYRNLNFPEKAIEYADKALELLKGKTDDPVSYTLYELAMSYSFLKQYKKSNEYLEKAMEICLQQNDFYLLETIYLGLADNALYEFKPDKAKMYLNKMLEMRGGEDNIDNNFGYFWHLGKLEELNGNFVKSEKYILRALEIANKRESLNFQMLSYTTLAELSVAQHKFKEHIMYLIKLEKAEAKQGNETSLHASEEMQVKYETEKKQFEIERQKEIIARQNMQRGLLAGGVAVSIVILALLWYMLRLRNRRNRALTERNNALSEMNFTKDKFFSIISHDLKNPALAQRNALQLLIKNARSWDVDALTDYYHDLLKSAEGQVELLYNLLNWAQIQTGRMAYKPIAFNLSTRLRSDISLIRKIAENKGITFVAELPDDALVFGDGNMLATVVRNLLNNAVKFTPAGGTVTLKASPHPSKGGEFSPPLGEPEGAYTVSVTDTGTGMSEEQIRNLFQLDSQYSQRGTAGEQGSGLGLIVCKELLEKHGSELSVESEEGKGSKFEFTISSLDFNTGTP